MTPTINDFFQQGLVYQAYQAERNILIWQYIGNEIVFLKSQKKDVQDLYSFVQQSAQTNFILSLGKLFDNPSKKYPTRCILSFLKLLETNSEIPTEIIEDTNTIKLLKEFNGSEHLIHAVTSNDKSLFPRLFASYYNERYDEVSYLIFLFFNRKRLKVADFKVSYCSNRLCCLQTVDDTAMSKGFEKRMK